MYGIKNCDTIKKARAWLDTRGVAYAFHDYKTAGLDRERLEDWTRDVGWEPLVNRAGTTFRKLADADKANLDENEGARADARESVTGQAPRARDRRRAARRGCSSASAPTPTQRRSAAPDLPAADLSQHARPRPLKLPPPCRGAHDRIGRRLRAVFRADGFGDRRRACGVTRLAEQADSSRATRDAR